MRDFKVGVKFTDSSKNVLRFFNEVAKQKLLSADEEAELATKAKKGDSIAREKLIKANLRFGISVAKHYSGTNCPLEDLICEANKGLVEAIEFYDPTTGFKFISYAVWHIRKNILIFINSHSRTVRIPLNIQTGIRNYQKAENFFISKNGREPSIEETIEMMEEQGLPALSKNSIDSIKNNPSTISLDPIYTSSDEDKKSPINILNSGDRTDHISNENDFRKTLESIMGVLTPTESAMIIMRYGLDGKDQMTYAQISEFFERTNEWARIVIKKAEKKMRIAARKKKIENIFSE
jgi:RNA polymerase primary sigma factor